MDGVPEPRTQADTSTPAGVEAELNRLIDASDAARKVFARCRDQEVDAELAFHRAERRAELSEDAPKVGVFGGVRTTVRMREMWVQDRVEAQYEAFRLATTARKAAGQELRVILSQISALQTISKSVNTAYMAPTAPPRGKW